MIRKLPTLWLRALRVTVMREDGTHWRFIVFEEVDRHRFRLSSSSGGSIRRRGEKPTRDRLDAWNVLRGLKSISGGPEEWRSYWQADSLDDLISEEAARMWAGFDQTRKAQNTRQEQTKERAPKGPRPMLVALPGPLPSGLSSGAVKSGIDAQMQTVWDYAGGNTLKWKSKRRTPAGYKCDVLTFSGSEIVSPGPRSVEIQ